MTRRRALALFALAAALAAPAVARADGSVTFLPSFDLYGSWTDNFLLTPDHSNQKRVTAYGTSFEPGLRLRYDSYRTEASIFASANFLHIWNHRGFDGWPENYNSEVAWAYWTSPSTRLTLGDQVLYYTDPRNQPFSTPRVIDTLRTESINNRLYGTFSWIPSPLAKFEAGYTYLTSEFRDPALWDSASHQVNLLWTQQVAPSYKLLIFYNFNRTLFSHNYDFLRHFFDHRYKMNPLFPVALHNFQDFDTHTPGVGMQYQTTPTLTVEVRSGVIVPAQETNHVYESPNLEWYQRIDITKLFWKMEAGANYTRDYSPAYGLGGAYLTQSVGGHLDERWTQKVETVQQVYYTNYSQPGTNLDTVSATAGATYYFFNWLGLSGSYNFSEQWGGPNGAHQRTTADLVVIRLVIGVPRPDWLRI